MDNLRQMFMFDPTDADRVKYMNLADRVKRAIDLLKDNEPPEGFYLAFSGGKDSTVCKELANMAGVKYDAWFNNTTIDAPETIHFIKKYHTDVNWNQPKTGNMFHRIATAPKLPPSRYRRWCCEEYKESTGVTNRVKIFGARADESLARKARWREITVTTWDDRPAICPIVYWTTDQVWEFIRFYNIPYCSLYDEGFERIGCVGCPLTTREKQDKEFERFPRYAAGWKRAIIKNWEKWKDIPNTKTGKPRFQANFKSGEAFFEWWRGYRDPDYIRGGCQQEQLWTNIPGITDDEDII
jgi:phosphoadenosine phosphosulfate reductase